MFYKIISRELVNGVHTYKRCKECGLTLDKYKVSGILGCKECYKAFREEINNALKNEYGNFYYKGKIPKGYNILKMKKDELEKRLDYEVESENYQEAAKLRDLLKNNYSER